ncbi:MAG: tRNA (cytidine(56)-2'-O)-methyltransferase [Candidatus Aenigmarchaeota archaeon]|nr:tRNA (cytidine(56)-2'-O)-methyltransferase [Candidatus Aenigmarchaeota archaeon]
MPISVLRLGHRLGRDARISTHCGLVARALGAREIIYTGERDQILLESVNETANRWGGPFSAKYEENWKHVVKKYRKRNFSIVHLTMYGMPVQKVIRRIRKKKNILVIIGGEKVPPQVYQEADFNIAVTGQPHSEVAALAIFLHEYFRGKELGKKFRGAKLKIKPQSRGKKVEGVD